MTSLKSSRPIRRQTKMMENVQRSPASVPVTVHLLLRRPCRFINKRSKLQLQAVPEASMVDIAFGKDTVLGETSTEAAGEHPVPKATHPQKPHDTRSPATGSAPPAIQTVDLEPEQTAPARTSLGTSSSTDSESEPMPDHILEEETIHGMPRRQRSPDHDSRSPTPGRNQCVEEGAKNRAR